MGGVSTTRFRSGGACRCVGCENSTHVVPCSSVTNVYHVLTLDTRLCVQSIHVLCGGVFDDGERSFLTPYLCVLTTPYTTVRVTNYSSCACVVWRRVHDEHDFPAPYISLRMRTYTHVRVTPNTSCACVAWRCVHDERDFLAPYISLGTTTYTRVRVTPYTSCACVAWRRVHGDRLCDTPHTCACDTLRADCACVMWWCFDGERNTGGSCDFCAWARQTRILHGVYKNIDMVHLYMYIFIYICI